MSRNPKKHLEIIVHPALTYAGRIDLEVLGAPVCGCTPWIERNYLTDDPNDPDLCGNCKRILKAREDRQ